MILVPKRWAGRIIHRGRAQVEPPASWHAFDRLGLGAAAPTVASSESDTDDGVQRRLRGVRARHAVDAGTDSGRGGRRRVWQRARANCQLSARLLAPRKMQRIFWMERSFEAGWCFGGWLPFAIACAADPVVCVAGDRRTNPAVSGSRQIMMPGCQDEPVFFSKKAAMPVREPTSCQACVSKYQIFHWRNEKQPLSLFSAPGVVGSLSKLVFQSRVLD